MISLKVKASLRLTRDLSKLGVQNQCSETPGAPSWVLFQSHGHCSRHNPPDMSIWLPDGDTAMVGHSSRQDTFLCQLLSLGVPAEHSGNDLILLIPPTGDVQPVVAGGNATAGSLMTELCHQTPAIFQRAVGIERSHGTTCKERTRMLGIFLGLSSLTTRVLLLIRADLPSYQRNSSPVAFFPESQDGPPGYWGANFISFQFLPGGNLVLKDIWLSTAAKHTLRLAPWEPQLVPQVSQRGYILVCDLYTKISFTNNKRTMNRGNS